MAGVNIYLTEKEQTMLIEYVTNGVSILGEAEGTWEQVQEDSRVLFQDLSFLPDSIY